MSSVPPVGQPINYSGVWRQGAGMPGLECGWHYVRLTPKMLWFADKLAQFMVVCESDPTTSVMKFPKSVNIFIAMCQVKCSCIHME